MNNIMIIIYLIMIILLFIIRLFQKRSKKLLKELILLNETKQKIKNVELNKLKQNYKNIEPLLKQLGDINNEKIIK